MLRPLPAALAAGLLFTLLSACAPAKMKADPQLPYPPATPPKVGDILHLPTGILVNEAQMLAAATDARIVYVGETHDNPASHRLQLQLLDTLAKRYPGRTALAMEMFTPARQQILDAWVEGTMSEKEFMRVWYEVWRMDFDYYRDLLVYARENGVQLLGINAEKSLVQTVGRKDFSELSEEEQRQLPQEIDQSDPYQTALTRSIFSGHSNNDNGRLAAFQRIQTLWDESMAENIARFLASPQGEDVHLLVIAGGNHVRNGFGIPRRVFRRLPVSYVLIGNEELEVSAEKKATAYMEVETPAFPMPSYDYLVFTRYEDLMPSGGVKLGVLLEERDSKVRIGKVLPDTAGARSGLLEGDLLLAADGEALATSFDLVYLLKQKKSGAQVVLTVERNGQVQPLTVSFPQKEMKTTP